LGLYLAFHTTHLKFDVLNRTFSATFERASEADAPDAVAKRHPAVVYAAADVDVDEACGVESEKSRSNLSSSSNSEDGFAIVRKPRMDGGKKTNHAASRPKQSKR
jgi:hypothetical protein